MLFPGVNKLQVVLVVNVCSGEAERPRLSAHAARTERHNKDAGAYVCVFVVTPPPRVCGCGQDQPRGTLVQQCCVSRSLRCSNVTNITRKYAYMFLNLTL